MDRNTASVKPSPPATDATTADATRTAPSPAPPTSVLALTMEKKLQSVLKSPTIRARNANAYNPVKLIAKTWHVPPQRPNVFTTEWKLKSARLSRILTDALSTLVKLALTSSLTMAPTANATTTACNTPEGKLFPSQETNAEILAPVNPKVFR